MNRSLARPLVAELLGTFLFLFVAMAAAVTTSAAGTPDALLIAALAQGLALAALVSALGAVSGGHFNPAVTFGVWAAGRMDAVRAALYVVAQLAGGLIAALTLAWVVFPGTVWPQTNLGLPILGAYTDSTAGLVVEAILTLLLALTVFGTAIDPRAPRIGGVAIGLVFAVGVMVGGNLTGGAMNPARWLAPAVVSQVFDNWWVWIVGPLLGAGLAALLYRFFAPAADAAREPASPEAGEPRETRAG